MISSSFRFQDIPIVSIADASSDLVTIQLMFKVGSAHEPSDLWGITHLIEHMVFKGSQRYSSFDISNKVEACGGDINAYTTKEYTTFYITGNCQYLSVFLDILLDICFHPLFLSEDLEKEKSVIANEILAVQDDPEELLQELFEAEVYSGQSIGRSIAGSVDSVNSLTVAHLKVFHQQFFGRSNCIVGIAGRFDIELLKSKIDQYFLSGNGAFVDKNESFLVFNPSVSQHRYHSEQLYLVKGYAACDRYDSRRYAIQAFNCMFGSAMCSRLYQRIREQLGLCYSIDTDLCLYSDGGFLGVYVNALPENLSQLYEEIGKEINILKQNGLSLTELETAKNIMAFGLVSIYESIEARLSLEMKQVLFFDNLLTKDVLMRRIMDINLVDVNKNIQSILNQQEAECILLP